MAVGGIDDDGIDSGLDQSLCTVHRVDGDANAGCYAQTTFVILAGHGLILGLRDILVGDEAHEMIVAVHHGKFFNLVFL